MAHYDKDEVLARIDLVQLFEELVGPVRREGSGARAACPNPQHPQTGGSPPVSIKVDGKPQLWRCHNGACSATGTAIDVVMLVHGVEFAEAIRMLGERTGVQPRVPGSTYRPPTLHSSTSVERQKSTPAGMETYVADAAAALFGPAGATQLAWLRARGFSDDVLRANRVGADVGRAMPRAEGLPHGPGVVFPVLDQDGVGLYAQLRDLRPDAEAKYRNPREAEWGRCPRVAVVTTTVDPTTTVLVCEGMPDALTAAGESYQAAAILGTAMPDLAVAQELVERFPTQALVLAFDGDAAGDAAAATMAQLLHDAGAGTRVWRLTIPADVAEDPKDLDLNTWATSTDTFRAELTAAVTAAEPAGWEPMRTAADLFEDFLAKLRNQAGALALPTGFPSLDRLLAEGGWRPGVVLLGGVPGIGKSAFALQTAINVTAAGHPVLYVSVEQSQDDLLGRMFCSALEMPIHAYWNRSEHYAAGVELKRPEYSLEHLYLEADPYIAGDDHQGTVGRIRSWAQRITDQTGAQPLVVVDYLQRMRPPEADRRLDERLRISQAGLGLRQLARDLEVPVLVVSSIGRANYEGEPSLGWFKGSGDLEYDADAAIILKPTDAATMTNGKSFPVELHLVKSRYGPVTGDAPVRLTFDRLFGSFHEQAPTRAAAGTPPPFPEEF